MKIDVEGFEASVLRGARDVISKQHPKLFIEFNSLTTIVEGRLLPHDLLDIIMDLYPHVAVIDHHSGAPQIIQRDGQSRKQFVARNLVGGFLDDLLCWFDDKPVRLPSQG